MSRSELSLSCCSTTRRTMSSKSTRTLLVLSVLALANTSHAYRPHPRVSAEAHTLAQGGRLNVTHDLLVDTPQQSSKDSEAFNFSHWDCLDRFLAGNEENPYEIESLVIRWFNRTPQGSAECKCFLNAVCHVSRGTDSPLVSSSARMSLWFRSYLLDDVHALQSFVQSLSTERLLKKVTSGPPGGSGAALLAPCLHADHPNISLRVDLVRSNLSAKSMFDFVEQLHSLSHVQLVSLSIRESSLDAIPSSGLSNWKHLKSLNLTRNQLAEFNSKELLSSEQNDQLVTLDLSHNNLSRVDLSWLAALKSIDLSFNNLSTLSASDLPEQVIKLFKSLQQHRKKPLLDFNLANNPWECDSRLSWLVDFISAIVEANGQIFESEHQLELFQTYEPECNSPHEAKMFPFSVWKSVKNVSICSKCDCHLEDKYAVVGYRYVIVNCTDRGLESLPADLPKNAKIIDLSNNRIRKLNTLHKLSLWGHVNKLILQNNSLEAIDGLDQVQSIVYLDISGNLLTEVPYHILDPVLSGKFDKVRIGNNPFTCDCNTIKMQKWLQNNYRIILDVGSVRCGYMRSELTKNESNIAAQAYHDRFHNREILKINSLELCPSSGTVELFDIINFFLALFIVLLIVKVLYDYFWQKRTGKLPLFFKLNM